MAGTAKQALDELGALVSSVPEVEVAVAFDPPGSESGVPSLRTLNLAEDAEGFFRNVVEKAVVKPAPRWNLRPLDILYKPEDREVEYRGLDELEPVKLALAPLDNLAPVAAFKPTDADLVN